MGKCTFKGGVHPYDGKEFSKDKPVKELFPAQGEMVFPLSQHIGAPAVPVVAKGDYVLAGQLIAEAGGFVSANIHSSVSGTVKAIEPRTLATGGKCNAIIIENDWRQVQATDSLHIGGGRHPALWGIDDEYPYRFSENPDKSAPGAGSRQAHPAESLCGGTA